MSTVIDISDRLNITSQQITEEALSASRWKVPEYVYANVKLHAKDSAMPLYECEMLNNISPYVAKQFYKYAPVAEGLISEYSGKPLYEVNQGDNCYTITELPKDYVNIQIDVAACIGFSKRWKGSVWRRLFPLNSIYLAYDMMHRFDVDITLNFINSDGDFCCVHLRDIEGNIISELKDDYWIFFSREEAEAFIQDRLKYQRDTLTRDIEKLKIDLQDRERKLEALEQHLENITKRLECK